METNIHFHVGPVEFKGNMRHLGKDAQERAGIEDWCPVPVDTLFIFKNHLDLTVIEVDKFGDNRERKQG